jgi:hypothetical protein
MKERGYAMKHTRLVLLMPAVVALACLPAFGQSVISAQSGLVHYIEGKVFVGDTVADPKFGQFPQLKENEVLRTQLGRAEVLLSPGVFLRLGEEASIRMLSTSLADARMELLEGSIVIEAPESGKESGAVTVVYKDTSVWLADKGIYRFDTEPAQLQVFEGEAMVSAGGKKLIVKKGKLLPLDSTLLVQKFDTNLTDALDRWSMRRAEYLAMANVSAAKQIADNGTYWGRGGWYWNPYFGMYTYVPWDGVYNSPYGWRFWSPARVYSVFYMPSYSSGGRGWGGYNPSLGYSTVQATSTGHSGTMASVPRATTSSSGSSSAPIPRESGSAGSRQR